MSKKQKEKVKTPYDLYEESWNASMGIENNERSLISKIIIAIVSIVILAGAVIWVTFAYALNIRNSEYGKSRTVEINDYSDLKSLGRSLILNNNYVLKADITIEDGEMVTIGSSSRPFCGTFDGGNKTIRYNGNAGDFSALFAYTSKDAEIKDLKVKGSAVLNKGGVGAAIVGHNYGKIINCTVDNFTISINEYGTAGGICAFNYGEIEGCKTRMQLVNTQSVSDMNTFFGGTCAKNYSDGSVLNSVCDVRFSSFPETEIYENYEYGGSNYSIGAVIGQNEGSTTGSIVADRGAYLSDRFDVKFEEVIEVAKRFN